VFRHADHDEIAAKSARVSAEEKAGNGRMAIGGRFPLPPRLERQFIVIIGLGGLAQ
jgi:hypothetical protein